MSFALAPRMRSALFAAVTVAAMAAAWLAGGHADRSEPRAAGVAAKLARFPVLATTRRVTTTLLELRIGSELLVTTPDHPFAGAKGWTKAGDLKVGDRLQTAKGDAIVTATRLLKAPPTPVYNLTVGTTHSYFAGRDAFLVHNVDCEDRDARELRIRRELEAHRRRMNRVTLNDSQGRAARENCSYCTMGALSDARKLSEFLQQHGFDETRAPYDPELARLIDLLGLTHPTGGPPQVFRPAGLKNVWTRLLSMGADRFELQTRRYESRMPEPAARHYMESLPGNTYMVLYACVERIEKPPGSGRFETESMGHAVTAVRREDGEVVYIDFQDVPPAVYERLPKTTFDVVVLPTAVDWRYNRQLYAGLRDGTVHPSL